MFSLGCTSGYINNPFAEMVRGSKRINIEPYLGPFRILRVGSAPFPSTGWVSIIVTVSLFTFSYSLIEFLGVVEYYLLQEFEAASQSLVVSRFREELANFDMGVLF